MSSDTANNFETSDRDTKMKTELDQTQSQNVQLGETITQDAVFGEITEGGPNYRNVGWLGTAALMMKIQIGLGVLSIPSAFDALGIVPGMFCLLAVGAITTWSSYVVGTFKIRHPEVYGIDDAGALMFGKIGRYVLGGGFCLCFIFVSGSGILGISIGLNSITSHGTCTAVFVAVIAVVVFGLSSIRTLGRIQWLAWIGLASIATAIMTITIAVGLQDRPAAAPQEGHWESDYKIANNPPFIRVATALSSFVFAYAGTPTFFSVVSEMRDPRQYTKSLLLCQACITVAYVTIGCVVYYFCGSYVASPALGSAGVLIKKVSYGLALPGLFATTLLCAHLPAKYIFVALLRGSRHLSSNTVTHWVVWLSCTFGTVLIAYIIASAIPVFGSLVSLVGALLSTFLAFQPMGCMWLYDNWHRGKEQRTLRWTLMVCWCVFVIVIGTFLMISGTYGSVVEIIDAYRKSGGSAAWSCVDNSGN